MSSLNVDKVARTAVLGAALFAMAGAAMGATANPPPAPLRLDAFAVNMSGTSRTRTANLEIVIDRWSSESERDTLLAALANKGSDRLLDSLKAVRPRAGFIRTTTSVGWDIQYAAEQTLPDGSRRIVFATDRPMTFRELWNRPRSADYEFMVCEIRLGPDGKGEGKLAPLAKVSFDKEKKQIEIENYGLEPVRLTQVAIET